MTTIQVTISQRPHVVFGALVDPSTYPEWLVGAQEIRGIEPAWPAPGSSFRHRVGLVGPLSVADSTSARFIDPPFVLELEVRARPFGRGIVRFELSAAEDGTAVRFEEHAIGLPGFANPLIAPLVRRRNRRSMERLEALLSRSTQ